MATQLLTYRDNLKHQIKSIYKQLGETYMYLNDVIYSPLYKNMEEKNKEALIKHIKSEIEYMEKGLLQDQLYKELYKLENEMIGE